MPTIYLRPSATIYQTSKYTCTPEDLAIHECINEVVCDELTTRVTHPFSSGSSEPPQTFTCTFSGQLPSNSYQIISGIYSATISTGAQEAQIAAKLSTSSDYTLIGSVNSSEGFVEKTVAINSLEIAQINNSIASDGSININVDMQTSGIPQTKSMAGAEAISQAYIELEYSDGSGSNDVLKIKTSGSYKEITNMYEKTNGHWVEQDIDTFLQGRQNNTPFEYDYGGDISD